MAEFNFDNQDEYTCGGDFSYFSLKNDKDVETVRFMGNSINDFIGHTAHEIEVEGKRKLVNCIKDPRNPEVLCPMCEAKVKKVAKLFVPLYNETTKAVVFWERGKTFYARLSSLCARYNPLVKSKFEIERNGKPGDTQTKYEIYPVDTDGTTLDDLPEIPEILGNLILDKTPEEMQNFVDFGTFEAVPQPTRRTTTNRPTF